MSSYDCTDWPEEKIIKEWKMTWGVAFALILFIALLLATDQAHGAEACSANNAIIFFQKDGSITAFVKAGKKYDVQYFSRANSKKMAVPRKLFRKSICANFLDVTPPGSIIPIYEVRGQEGNFRYDFLLTKF